MHDFFFLLNNEIRKKITGSENPRKCWLSNYLIADNYFIFHDTIECEGNFRSHLASPAQSSLIALVHLPQVAFFFLFKFAVRIFASCLLLFSHLVLLDSVIHGVLLCPLLSPGVCSNSCPLWQGCHPTISSSVFPFFSCPQSFPASESFPFFLCFYINS